MREQRAGAGAHFVMYWDVVRFCFLRNSALMPPSVGSRSGGKRASGSKSEKGRKLLDGESINPGVAKISFLNLSLPAPSHCLIKNTARSLSVCQLDKFMNNIATFETHPTRKSRITGH